MSEVIVTFKVMPTGVEVDLSKLENDIRQKISPQRVTQEPVAFGLVALIVTTLVDDAEGTLEKVESALRSIENVNEVEVTEMTRSI
ncbi:MAG: elongation factor 1-beta [Candidatus Aenigmarchaeota archaeon]|nr:elongation factor 1-beta [Candidatus Aenigmarchaeota archaeon]